jgi:hypothetical protein
VVEEKGKRTKEPIGSKDSKKRKKGRIWLVVSLLVYVFGIFSLFY